MMFKEVVKHYRKAPPDLEKELNSEAKMLAHRLGQWAEAIQIAYIVIYEALCLDVA